MPELPESKGALTLAQAVAEAGKQLDEEAQFFAPTLPPNIPLDKFKATVIWALNENPDLLRANRHSLLIACAKAANDGLLPDKKEGALVIYNVNQRRKVDGNWQDHWIKKVQWMPMVYGITKKALGTGQVLSLYAMIVYQAEIDAKQFTYRIEDGHHRVNHEPILWGDRGEPILAYAVAILASGVVEVQPMTLKDIARIQAVSRSKDKKGNPSGPWKDWQDEMWKKSAIRRLSKRIPFTAEVEQVIRRDDEMVDLTQDQDDDRAPTEQNLATASAIISADGFPPEAPGLSAPVAIDGEFSDEPDTDDGEEGEDLEPPPAEPTQAELLERVKVIGRQQASQGTKSLRQWWSGLAFDVQIALAEFKDTELKPLAAQHDAGTKA